MFVNTNNNNIIIFRKISNLGQNLFDTPVRYVCLQINIIK